MIETPSAAFLQSSRERRSPVTSSTFLAGIELAERFLETAKPAGGPNKAAEIGKAVFEKNFDHLYADETVGPSDQDAITRRKTRYIQNSSPRAELYAQRQRPALAFFFGIREFPALFDSLQPGSWLRSRQAECRG